MPSITRKLLFIAIILLSILAFGQVAQTASPPQPSYGTAVVDGNISEWDLTNDFFTNMYRAGNPSRKLESKAYLRYDCNKNTLYVLVLVQPGVTGLASGWETSAWGAINTISNKVYTGNSGNPPTPPQFAWVGLSADGKTAQGYEASFIITPGTPLSPAFYTLLLHIEVYDDNNAQTSATPGFPQAGVQLELICGYPSIDIQKTYEWTTGDGSHVGDVLTYTYKVTNIGLCPLDPVSVVDDKLGPITLLKTSLAVGESTTGTATVTITQEMLDAGSITNTATATGKSACIGNVTDTDTETVTLITHPSIQLAKNYEWTTGNGSHVGDVVTYTYTVTNTGNVTLNPVTVTDDKLGTITLAKTSLAPGESTTGTATLTLTQELLDAGSQTNIATATGKPPTGDNVTSTVNKTVTFITTPSIDVKKTFEWTTGDGSHVGDVVTYTYTVKNTGNVTLNPVTAIDNKLGTITLAKTSLAPGETTTGTATLTLTQELLDAGSQTNIVTATGTPPTGPNVTNYDSQTVIFGGTPSIEIKKTAVWTTGDGSHVGDILTYTYTVKNTGNVKLDPVSVSDDYFGAITLLKTSLEAGETTTGTATLTLTQELLNQGSVTNIATATGTPPSGPNVTDLDRLIVTFTAEPAIELVKTYQWTTGDGSQVGDIVTFTYTVTNTGNVTLDPVSVNDDKLGSITLAKTSLNPGESTTGTTTLTLTQELLNQGSQTNTGTATGTPPSGPDVTSTSTKTVTFITTPSIHIQKSFAWTTGNGSHVGDIVTYTYSVTNTGNVILNPVTVSDDMFGPIVLSKTSLDPNESTTGNATLTLTQELLDTGSQTNTATATGTPPSGQNVSDHSTQIVKFIDLPNIGIVKSVSVDGGTTWVDANIPPGPSVIVGAPVQWRYVVTNIGNVTLSNVSLNDNILGSIVLSETQLAPNESTTAYADGIAISGQYINIGTTKGTPQSGPTAQATDPSNYYGKGTGNEIYQAYPGSTNNPTQSFMGYNGIKTGDWNGVPGILCIVPGDKWSNYVAAAQFGIEYTLKNVSLKKVTPQIVQCSDVFVPKTITQQGTANIRLWWPLLYEIPGTTFTLDVFYGTPVPFDDDQDGPDGDDYAHLNEWTWTVDANTYSMMSLVDLFHRLPFGRDEVPLISDENLYTSLEETLLQINDLVNIGQYSAAGAKLSDFELMVMDACISSSPDHPNPTGVGTGIANTYENPACCKLLADCEYLGKKLGIFIQNR